MVSQDSWEQLEQRMAKLGVRQEDLVEKFIRGTGSGGQKINKTSSCVYIKHEPSGIEVKCQQSRSREDNRLQAREDLCRVLEQRIEQARLLRRQAAEKARRRNRPRPRKVKERMLRSKRRRSDIKKQRGRPGRDD